VDHARRLMIEHNVRRLPVIGRDHHLVGIVNFADTEGRATPVKKATRATFHKKKAIMVTFHKKKTDSYGRPHNSPLTMWLL
jgi:CBS-domain-containing membrane protein